MRAGAFGGGGAAVEPAGNVYFSDNDFRVKRIRTDGIIEFVAGNGTTCRGEQPCGDGGPATSAQLRSAIGVDVAANGDVFIVDYQARKVRKVRTSDGVITTIAGNGQTTPATTCGYDPMLPMVTWPSCTLVEDASTTGLNQPQGITVAANGIVYFAETDSGVVRRLIPHDGVYRMRTVAPGFTFSFPVGVALDPTEQFLYVVDGTLRVLRVDLANDSVTPVAGTANTACAGGANPCGDGGPAAFATLEAPGGIVVDPTGAIYLGQDTSGRIRKFAPGGVITTVAGTGVACVPPSPCGDGGSPLAAQFLRPRGLAFESQSGRLWVSDYGDPRVRFIAPPPGATTEAAQALTHVRRHHGRHAEDRRAARHLPLRVRPHTGVRLPDVAGRRRHDPRAPGRHGGARQPRRR